MKWHSLAPFEGKPATVYPIDDLRDHSPDDERCWCRPFFDGDVLVHNSMDRREEFERGRKVS